jgi:hypothetical protein
MADLNTACSSHRFSAGVRRDESAGTLVSTGQ